MQNPRSAVEALPATGLRSCARGTNAETQAVLAARIRLAVQTRAQAERRLRAMIDAVQVTTDRGIVEPNADIRFRSFQELLRPVDQEAGPEPEEAECEGEKRRHLEVRRGARVTENHGTAGRSIA
jgi:hypothetical protein